MRFIVALVVSFALVWACAKPLKKHPVPFYVCAVALVALYFWGRVRRRARRGLVLLPAAHAALRFGLPVVHRGHVRGRARRGEPAAHPPLPIRPALSILACIFAAGTSPSTAPPTCRAWRAPSPATWPSPWGSRRSSPRSWWCCGSPRPSA